MGGPLLPAQKPAEEPVEQVDLDVHVHDGPDVDLLGPCGRDVDESRRRHRVGEERLPGHQVDVGDVGLERAQLHIARLPLAGAACDELPPFAVQGAVQGCFHDDVLMLFVSREDQDEPVRLHVDGVHVVGQGQVRDGRLEVGARLIHLIWLDEHHSGEEKDERSENRVHFCVPHKVHAV